MTLRIISGERRGAHLKTPEGKGTRPLRDRVREALFNILRPEIRGAHVLDAFAGSGAVGLEALSNGARQATFVEPGAPACRVIEQNIAKLRYEDRTRILRGRAPQILRGTKCTVPFDILFLMPPYHSALCEAVLNDEAVRKLCAPRALAVGEIHLEEHPPEAPAWKLLDERAYGVTKLLFWERQGN